MQTKLTSPLSSPDRIGGIHSSLHRNADITVAIDPRMLHYDFSRFRLVESLPPGHPNLATTTYRPIEAKTLRRFIAEKAGKVLFAANGQTDNLWTPNGVVVVNGNVFKRTAPGIGANEVIPLQGSFPFFVFDADKMGINLVSFKNGEAESEISFFHGIYSPVIIADFLGNMNINFAGAKFIAGDGFGLGWKSSVLPRLSQLN